MSAFFNTQGLLLTAYPKLAAAAYLFFKVDDPPASREALRRLQPQITFYDRRDADVGINIAFTSTGLQALGLTPDEMQTFAVPFSEGIAAGHRSYLLGDLDADSPVNWRWGRQGQVDFAIMVFAKTLASRDSCVDAIVEKCCANGANVLVTEPVLSQPHPDEQDRIPAREHFGFRDGMSQPVIEEVIDAKGAERAATITEELRRVDGRYFDSNIVPAGEFIFGFPNCYGIVPAPPLVTPKPASPLTRADSLPSNKPLNGAPQLDFGRHGTYLVLRQLKQQVSRFWQALSEHSKKNAAGEVDLADRELLAAKIVGRWRNGASLTEYPDAEPAQPPEAINDFTFRIHDPHGDRCPLGAHIRRANPRDALDSDEAAALAIELVNRHRILRRGRPYGPWLPRYDAPDDGADRGLVFAALNVNIERQFEFIQNAWINNVKFAGLYSENDPLISTPRGDASGGMFTIQAQPVRKRIHNLGRFVQLVGGGYFFLPGRDALAHLLL